mmetsp:Transcript_32666/g.49929  ORF Transcript_32666/g.49929 Transcript_32666/m.49929 type:complete len:94 (-) Transcript_32666:347-628(-)
MSNLNVTRKKPQKEESSEMTSEGSARFKLVSQIDVLDSPKQSNKGGKALVKTNDASYRTSKTLKRGEGKQGKMLTPLIREDQLNDSELQISID